MNKVYLIVTLLSCTSICMADDMKVTNLAAAGSLVIEQKNSVIMSNYKNYSQANHQQMELKKAVTAQQYSQFLTNKRSLVELSSL